MKILSFLLNLPWTVLGLIFGLISRPTKLDFRASHLAIVVNVKSFWWYSWLPKMSGVRAMALGNVVMLGPNILPYDLEHELIHVEQATKTPLIHPILYIFETLKNGYGNNKYEKEAYGRAGNRFIR